MRRLAVLSLLLVSAPSWGILGDLDRDGDVDLRDFFIFSDNFGNTGEVEECGDPIPSSPLTFSDDGTQTTGKFQLQAGLRVIRVSKTPSTESIVVGMLDGVTGDRFSAGGIHDFDDKGEVSKSFQVEETNTYVINVDTGAEWTITIDDGEAIPSIPAGNPVSLSGDGTQTTGKFTLESGLRVIRVTKTPPSENIAVTMLDAETGDRFSAGSVLDIDDLAEVSKSFQVEDDEAGEYVVNVDTGGSWTILIE